MKNLLAASALTLVVSTVVPTSAVANHPTAHHRSQYERLYRETRHKFGTRAPGRNIVRYGLASGKTASDELVTRSISVLERMLAPPPVAALPTATSSLTTAASSTTTTSGSCGGTTPYSGAGQCWAIPYSIVSCESGGQNVPNTQGSGANGYYQLMSGGTGSRASQDAAAAALWAGGAGAGNWVCKG